MVTNLSIRSGEKVVGFILVPQRDSLMPDMGGGYCYSTDMWQPMCVPFVGFYNDYGSIESIESTPLTKMLSKHFGFKNEEDLLDYCERDRETNKIGKYALALVHYEMYELMLFQYEDGIKKDREELKELLKGEISGLDEDDKFQPMLDFIIADNLRKLMGCNYGNGVYSDPSFVNKLSELEDVDLSDVINTKYVYYFMENARKMWMPGAGAGSQSTNLKHQTLIANFINVKHEEENKRCLEEYGEEYGDW